MDDLLLVVIFEIMIKILNLYSGIGGNRKLWKNVEVTAIENNEEIAKIYKDNFSNDNVIVTDAHQFLLEHIQEFDFIWSSPPCPTHSELQKMSMYRKIVPLKYPDLKLYQEIVLLRYFAKKQARWVVENVNPYYKPWIVPSVQLGRHSFWTNFQIRKIGFKDNEKPVNTISNNDIRYKFDLKNYKIKKKDQILANLVNPEIGLYLFNESQKRIKQFFNFNY